MRVYIYIYRSFVEFRFGKVECGKIKGNSLDQEQCSPLSCEKVGPHVVYLEAHLSCERRTMCEVHSLHERENVYHNLFINKQ